MLGVNERRAKLEDMLGRVQRNRSRRADHRTATEQADIELPRQPKVEIKETAAPIAASEPHRETPAVQPSEKPVPASPDPISVAKEPDPVAEASPPIVEEPAQEVREFASAPTSSGAVAIATGQSEREWTLSAVLERAWKLGSLE